MGRPHTWCNTLGTSDFMRVPIPAARITTASGGRLPVGLSVICLTCREWWSRVPPARPEVAGAGGFEPPDAGTKTRCLTTWLRPSHFRTRGRHPRPPLPAGETYDRQTNRQAPAARITTASGGRLPVGLSVICLTCREWWSRVPPARPEVAGAGGFEPPDA